MGRPDAFSVGISGSLWVTAFPTDQDVSDLYRMDFRITRLGIPVSASDPVNFTNTSSGQEELLDVKNDKCLSTAERFSRRSIVHLDFVEGFASESLLAKALRR